MFPHPGLDPQSPAKIKTQRYRDTEIIKLILWHSVPLCWKANGRGQAPLRAEPVPEWISRK